MKRLPALRIPALLMVVALIAFSLMQCTKNDNALILKLDRSFTGIVDSTIYASFYDTVKIIPSDIVPDANDRITKRSVKTILRENCATSNCHGGAINPSLITYEQVMRYVTPGNPITSKLWDFITTNVYDKAMPPVNSNKELTGTDKQLIFNWIYNGAKEYPDLKDLRPVAIRIITDGCGSANCHHQATATGAWARKGLIPGLVSSDTTQYIYTNPVTGIQTVYCQLSNAVLRDQVWSAYKDSVRKFYFDTLANASFRPYKTFTTPVSALSTRGPLNTYDDILLDIYYPKSARSNSSVQYVNGSGQKFYAKGNYLNVTSSLVTRIDSTLLLANPYTGVFATNHQGDMAYGDGGLKPAEVALIKAWYFADPNIPDVWKYGQANAGIFKYRKPPYTIIKQ